MQDSPNRNEIIEKISRRLRCSTCGRRYKPYDFVVLEERENIAVIRIVCRDCHKQSVVLAIIERRRVRPFYCELDPVEWERFKNEPPIASDDVVNLHRTMQAYDGDLSDVLEDPLPPGSVE